VGADRTLTIDVSGFHDATESGAPATSPRSRIASTKEKLLAEFDRAELVALLDHLVRLRTHFKQVPGSVDRESVRGEGRTAFRDKVPRREGFR